jgi:S-DNA-T family DNA segregation ATPase FtsK/SpoIIIE
MWRRHAKDLWIVGLLVAGAFVLLADVHLLGPVGHGLTVGLSALFGRSRWLLPLAAIGAGVVLVVGRLELALWRLSVGIGLALVAASGLFFFADTSNGFSSHWSDLGRGGGWLGVAVGRGLRDAFGTAGTVVVLLALLLIALMFLTGLSLRSLALGLLGALRLVGRGVARLWHVVPKPEERRARIRPVELAPEQPSPAEAMPPSFVMDDEPLVAESAPVVHEQPPVVEPESDHDYDLEPVGVVANEEPPTMPSVTPKRARRKTPATASHWVLPDVDLLVRTNEQRQDRAAIDTAGAELVAALAAHGVATTLAGYTVGPTVTRFELELGAGVKVAQVTSLHRDIAYAMASPDVRILAPIPGRSAIGVEVPNRQRALVTLGDLLASEEAADAHHALDVPLGRDIAGRAVVVNLAEMPHVLISGATGAGKSSCINSIITSLVMRATPDQMKLILIDPKRVELGQYNDLPHLLSPVVVDPKRAAGALNWAVKEMERRYDILAQYSVRDILGYQHLLEAGELATAPTTQEQVSEVMEESAGLETPLEVTGPEPLPYIVIVVDELNDLMMVAAREVEDAVVRIAQMARAVGIHLVLATQRPSVDVITGVIKANIPSRMAFAVSSLADSRVILDQAGAERLIGKGDMLMLTSSSNVARRLQAPWVSEEEVRKVVTFWRAQGGTTETVVAVSSPLEGPSGFSEAADEDDDVVLAKARDLVLRTQSGSTSMLQRKLRVGFARAGRLMDQLEIEGVVAAGEGSKARRVLLTLDQYEAQHPNTVG